MNPEMLFSACSNPFTLHQWREGSSWPFDVSCKDSSNSYNFHFTFNAEQDFSLSVLVESPNIESNPLVIFQFIVHDANGKNENNIVKRFSVSLLSEVHEKFNICKINENTLFDDKSVVVTITVKGVASIFTHTTKNVKKQIPSPKRILNEHKKNKSMIQKKKKIAFVTVDESDEESDDLLTQIQPILTQNINPKKCSEYDFATELSNKKFIGLINQGSTCYLNSLLQVLYNIPAFRMRTYTCTSHTELIRSLQNIFCCLECSKYPISTKELTRSFGWSSKEAAEQQDYHEFVNVFFDVIKKPLGSCLQFLFHGRTRTFIRCKYINNSSETYEDFYSLSLDVSESDTLEESLHKFLQRSTLTGDNMYDCGPEYGKHEADIGVEIVDLPRVLQIHLQRFEYDDKSKKSIKINSEIKFDKSMDMMQFISESDINEDISTEYELYGVVVHNGTSESGHYYTFLRPYINSKSKLVKDKWFKFNDTSVEESNDIDAINNNFGGKDKSYSAYILYYVRSDSIDDVFYSPLSTIHASDFRVIPQETKKACDKTCNKLRMDHEVYNAGYIFKLVTNDSLVESSSRGIMSWNIPQCVVEVSRKAPIDELFVSISQRMKIERDKMRLFGIMSSNYLGCEITQSNTFVGLQRYDSIYVTTTDELPYSNGNILVPIFLYVPYINDPLRFISVEKRNIKDSISSLFDVIKRKYGKGKMIAYISRGMNNAEVVMNPLESFKTNFISNGTIFVLQYDYETVDPHFPKVNDPNRVNCFSSMDVCRFKYYTDFKHSFPKCFSKFLNFRQMNECIRIRTPKGKHEKLCIPKNIKFPTFKKLIASVFGIDYNEFSDTMLLYANDSHTPISETIEDFTVLSSLRNIRFSGELVPIVLPYSSQTSFNHTIRTIIQITNKNKKICDEFPFIVPDSSTCADIVSNGVTKEWFPKNATIRIVTEGPEMILTSYSMEKKLVNLPNPIRLDIVSEFMKHISDSEIEITIMLCERDKGGKIHAIGCTFVFQVNVIETVSEIKERIYTYINEDKNVKNSHKTKIKELFLKKTKKHSYFNLDDDTTLTDVMNEKYDILCAEIETSPLPVIKKQIK